MSEPLLLVAASGLARETAQAAATSALFEVSGVLDDNPALWGTRVSGIAVLGPPEIALEYPDHRIALCAGKGSSRAALAGRLAAAGMAPERYATVIHPAASVASSCHLGAGSIVLAGVVLTAEVTIGVHAVLMPNAVLTHDNWLGDHVTVCAGVCLAGFVRVEDLAYLGASATVRERVRIGTASVVGMGSVVLSDVPAAEVWAGNPARPLRGRPASGDPAAERGAPADGDADNDAEADAVAVVPA